MAIAVTRRHWLLTVLFLLAQGVGIFAMHRVFESHTPDIYPMPIGNASLSGLTVKVTGLFGWATFIGWLVGSSLLTAIIVFRLYDIARSR